MSNGNKLKEIREVVEGISKAELSRVSGVAEKIIRKIENNDMNSARTTTKARLVNALNEISGKFYAYRDVFPNG